MPNVKQINLDNLKLGYVNGTTVDKKQTKDFVKKLKEIADKHEGLTPEDLLSVMIKENSIIDGKLLLDQESQAETNDKGGHAKGLIQFVPKTAASLGLDQSKLSTMTPVEQLEYVEKFYDQAPKNSLKDYGSLYMYTFQPKAFSKGDDYVIGEKDSSDEDSARRYKSNSALDKNNDGKLTVSDFKQYANSNIPKDTIPQLFSDVSKEDYDKSYKKIVEDLPDVIQFSESVKQKDGRYKTEYKTPTGVNKAFITNNPVKFRKIGNGQYIQDGDRYFEFNDTDGIVNNVTKDLNKVYDNELVKIENKVKEGNHLNQKELTFAENIYAIKEEQLKDARRADSKNAISSREAQKKYESLLAKQRERYYKKIIMPEEKKYLQEEWKQKEKEINDLQSSLLNPELSAEQLTKNRDLLSQKKDEFEDWKEDAREDFKDYKWAEKNIGTKTTGAFENPNSQYIVSEDRLNKTKEKLSERKSSIPLDAAAEKEKEGKLEEVNLKKKAEPIKYSNGRLEIQKQIDATKKEVGTGIGDLDPDGLTTETAEDVAEIAPFVDKEELATQNKLDQETIDFIKSQKDIKAPMPEEETDYSSILGNIADIGKMGLGLIAASKDIPEYEKGAMFSEYAQDARRLKDQGLTAQEWDYQTKIARDAYGLGMQQFRGAGASAALVGAGEQSRIYQEQMSRAAIQDQALRRDSRQRFADAAIRDESINRQMYEDRLNQALANKKAGAELARDAYVNMNERAQFNQQYGKGSQYQQYMNEMIASQKEAREASKQSRAFQKQQAISTLEKQIAERQSKIDNA